MLSLYLTFTRFFFHRFSKQSYVQTLKQFQDLCDQENEYMSFKYIIGYIVNSQMILITILYQE